MPTTTVIDRRAGTLSGTGALLRFQLRRTRSYLIFWFLGLLGFNAVTVPAVMEMYPDATDRAAFAQSLNNPPSLAMTGPETYISDYSVMSMIAHNFLLWNCALLAVMVVLLVTRLTRSDEETSRLEVVRSEPVGRHSDLAAAVLLTCLASVAMALGLTLVTGPLSEVGWGEALLFGAATGAVGIFFSAIATLTAQLASFGSTANGLSFTVLGTAFVFAALGNSNGTAAVWASPLAWAQQTFVGTEQQRWWPMVLLVGVAVVVFAAAFAVVTRRDFGAGLLPARKGRVHAPSSLRGIRSLTLRLTRGLTITAVVTLALLGLSYGSIFAEAESQFEAGPEFRDQMLEMGDNTFQEGFAVLIASFGALVAVVFGIMMIGRARKEETEGAGEVLAALPVSRRAWPGAYFIAAQLVTSVGLLVYGVVLGALSAQSTGDSDWFGTLFLAAAVYLPAVWILISLAFVCYAYLPRWGIARWLPWMFVLFIMLFGPMLSLNDAVMNVSPFEHTPNYPVGDVAWTPMVAMTGIAIVLGVAGYLGIRHRNLQFS
ncbi:ABC transporter permease [Haloglycomyces albus]|uniref:ABC transporter permease n=1 Tax=Haloglycomyces albus TaxID=526067 RepID=UPI00046CCF64|nr:hypothetical protein [Haloglycomyces albus]